MKRRHRTPLGIARVCTQGAACFLASACLALLILAGHPAVAAAAGAPPTAAPLAAEFDRANKLYEQRHYAEAAAVYQELAAQHPRQTTLLFNLGNAQFKAGHLGLAIAAWRRAEELNPRDPSLRFNLKFAREQVSGQDQAVSPWPGRWLASLTLNEWTALAALAFWTWFGLLAAGQWSQTARRFLKGYTAATGVAALALAACLAAALLLHARTDAAVVVVPEAIVRFGPLPESQVSCQLRDGAEVTVLDRLQPRTPTEGLAWLQIRDAAGRVGWLREDQVVQLRTQPPAHSP